MQPPSIPARMKYLPIDPVKGLPVPWFVPFVDGKPEWRAADAGKRELARDQQLCWVCGGLVYERRTFVLGPMCALNRTTAEPCCHAECALYSAQACPFLSRPRMERRRNDDLAQKTAPTAGHMIERNPGCVCLWETKGWDVFADGKGGWLFDVGEPASVTWWAEGRPAKRGEVLTSIVTGLPHLQMADDPAAWEELARRWVEVDRLLPKA